LHGRQLARLSIENCTDGPLPTPHKALAAVSFAAAYKEGDDVLRHPVEVKIAQEGLLQRGEAAAWCLGEGVADHLRFAEEFLEGLAHGAVGNSEGGERCSGPVQPGKAQAL
jgi:hypothetical protein